MSANRPAQVTEVKRHLDGRVERFSCVLVAREPHIAVLRFDHQRRLVAGGAVFPAGGRTYGFFWPRRPYVLYRITGPGGALILHRFDVVEDVRLGEREVSYLDLLLDVLVDPSGNVRVEDEDDVAEYARRGLLSDARQARIERAKAVLLGRHAAIEREAVRLLARFGAV
jgi:predicted RNA-binding protein associated with RNAse of E/G family